MRRLTPLILLVLANCGPGTQTARETIDRFVHAVQDRDTDALYCLLAGAAGDEGSSQRATFEEWAASRYAEYEAGRDAGWVDPADEGITLVKLFALGRGAFYQVSHTRTTAPNAFEARTELRFGYSALNLSALSPGTTFYVCGTPVGRVVPVRVPRAGEIEVDVLERIAIDWTFVRRDGEIDGCATGWTVGAVVADPSSASTETITWIF